MEKELLILDKDYTNWVIELSNRYKSSQIKAARSVNVHMIKYYWDLGRDIDNMDAENKYGTAFYRTLSKDLKKTLPDTHGLSETNIRYAARFYRLYSSEIGNLPQLVEDFTSPILPQVVEEFKDQSESSNYALLQLFSTPWGHHRVIIDKVKGDPHKAFFYIHKTIENNWSRGVLLTFIDSNLYEVQGKAITNFTKTLPSTTGDLARELLKDPYKFDFLTLTESFQEAELKNALINNITKFLIELGSGFAYMGREYHLRVGSKDQYMDLLFYNTRLHCYCVIEVKVTDFEPSYLGQLSAYISFTDHILKREQDNPTIGLLICKSKDNVFAQYSLEGYNQPIGISEFEGVNLLPPDFKSSLPTIEEIEKELKGND